MRRWPKREYIHTPSAVQTPCVQALLAEAKINAESEWDAVKTLIEDDPRYAALSSTGERRRIFESIVSDIRQQAASLGEQALSEVFIT